MPDDKTQVERFVNCHKCWTEGVCVVEFGYTEAGRINAAEVSKPPQGWEYRPLGEEGGQAPYCPACQ
jgi:hypothetical protein